MCVMSTRAQVVAQGVSSWVQFEIACKRGGLLSEASLSQPLGQILAATGSREVSPEVPHPLLKDAWIDFVEKGAGGVIELAVETKWINGRREMKQEILDDLVRLELVHTINRQTDRWLLIAGEHSHLEDKVFNAEFNVGGGGGRVKFSPVVLPATVGPALTIDIGGSQGPWRAAWKKTPTVPVVAPAVAEWPDGMKTELLAKHPSNPASGDVVCFVWHVGRKQNRSVTQLP